MCLCSSFFVNMCVFVCRELLTPQQHYDWGLRALKTVLRGCGSLLQLQRQSNNPCNTISLESIPHELQSTVWDQLTSVFSVSLSVVKESGLVVQALRLNTMSKLTFADSSRFDALVRDVFPAVDFKDVEYETLKSALLAVYEEARLEIIPSQVPAYHCYFNNIIYVYMCANNVIISLTNHNVISSSVKLCEQHSIHLHPHTCD